MTVTLIIPHRPHRWIGTLLRWTGNMLLAVGIVCAGWYVLDFSEAGLYQAYEKARLEEALKIPEDSAYHQPLILSTGDFVGRLEIPRIGIDAAVLEGDNSRILKLGVGHLPGSALPGERGNVSLAAHRDTFFRALRHIKTGDLIRFTTFTRSCLYRVDWTKIVPPSDTRILRPSPGKDLTLVTCYPFYFVGSAPERFIVRAHQLN